MTAISRAYGLVAKACRAWAIAGGAVMCGAMTITVVSVVGRATGIGPVDGDFEIMEIATAIAVFSFMPYAQIRRGHVIVDVFTQNLPRRWLRFLNAMGAVAISIVALMWLWRMPVGGWDFYRLGDETTVLRYERWWSFPLILPSLALFAAACVLSIFHEDER